jgi:hypothetical protein
MTVWMRDGLGSCINERLSCYITDVCMLHLSASLRMDNPRA